MKRTTLGWSMAGLLALICNGAAWGQGEAPAAPPAAPETPKAEYKGPSAKEIIERYLEVTGGRAAHEKIKNREMTGTMEVPAAGVKGTTRVIQAAPNKMAMKIDLGGFGAQTMGTDGEVAWHMDTIQGARILEGEERTQVLREAIFDRELQWEKLYKEATAESEQEIDGKPAYAVKLVTTEGITQTNYYEKESGLLVRIATIAKSQMGDMPVDTNFSDFREIDGIKMPHKTIINSGMGVQIITTIDSVKQNAELPADTFAIPDEVKKALDASKPADAPASEEPKKE